MTAAHRFLLLLPIMTLAVVGAVASLLYLPLRIGSYPAPISALVAMVFNVVLVSWAGEISTRPGVLLAPVAAWFVAVILAGSLVPGGDRLLPGDWRLTLLVMAGLAPPVAFAVRLTRGVGR